MPKKPQFQDNTKHYRRTVGKSKAQQLADEMEEAMNKKFPEPQSVEVIVNKYITRETHKGSVNRIRHLMTEELGTILAQEVKQTQVLWLSDLSRAVGILEGLGHPDEYLSKQRTKLLERLG